MENKVRRRLNSISSIGHPRIFDDIQIARIMWRVTPERRTETKFLKIFQGTSDDRRPKRKK